MSWTFPEYGYLLLAPTLLFFACSLVMPGDLQGPVVELEAHFFKVRRPLMWTFLLFTLVAVFDGPLLGTEPILHRCDSPIRRGLWLQSGGSVLRIGQATS